MTYRVARNVVRNGREAVEYTMSGPLGMTQRLLPAAEKASRIERTPGAWIEEKVGGSWAKI